MMMAMPSNRSIKKLLSDRVETKTPNMGKFRRTLCRLKNVYIFYGHLEYITVIWNILRTLGIFCVYFEYFVFILNILCSF
jgi:hypothetical protein